MSASTMVVPTTELPAEDNGSRSTESGRKDAPPADPRWVRPALALLLLGTAVLYLWDLGRNGWANTFYSGAVQAGTRSWKAFFFGSSDAANFITVDKSPLALWPMEISARIFGLSSWSVLAPQALMGVATVGVVYATVRRWMGAGAGLLAGAVCALTPVATLMFRFNNPDAALVLLMTIGAYCTTRAIEDGRTRWVVGAGVAVGLAFLAKELQAFLVLPAFGLAYLWAAPGDRLRRLRQTVVLGIATLVAGGWWVAVVELWPASSRPYIGGSQDNTFLDVLFGYNGFGRLTGAETGSVGGAPGGGAGRWGATGLLRLFDQSYGGQASWLLPAALILLVAGIAARGRRPRTDRVRAALILWGGWLVVTGLAISLGEGIIHEYYTVALAPAIGGAVGVGGVSLWRRRQAVAVRWVLATAVLVTVTWAWIVLARTPDWLPWLRVVVLAVGLPAALVLVVPSVPRRILGAAVVGAIVVGLAAPTAFSLATVDRSTGGALPLAGPATAAPGGPRGGFAPGGLPPGAAAAGRRGGAGGLLGGTQVGSRLSDLLTRAGRSSRWAAAAVGANTAASYQLASRAPILAIGGFNGSDPAPTLRQFRRLVRRGDVRWFIAGGGPGGGPGGGGPGGVPGTGTPAPGGFPGGGTGGPGGGGGPGGRTSSAITAWVTSHFSSRTVSGVTLYDLRDPLASAGAGNVV